MRLIIKKVLFSFLRLSGFNFFCQCFFYHRLFLIGYHSILPLVDKDPRFAHVCLDRELFISQLNYLLNQGHNFFRLSDLLSANLKNVIKPTVLFFDDGFKDNLTVVLPILQELGIKATFFVVPDYLDKPNNDYLDWADVRQLIDAGMDIGSHSYHHHKLSDLNYEEIKFELLNSKKRIEEELGQTVKSFCYPKGRFDDRVLEVMKSTDYKLAVTTKYGLNKLSDLGDKPFTLKRIAPRVYENLAEFSVRVYSYNFFKR